MGVCWAAVDNPNPRKEISKLIFHAPLEGGIYAVIGVTLADRPHYVPPKGESFGGPDNWAAATGMAALVEGLAESKMKDWPTALRLFRRGGHLPAIDSVRVTVALPASNAYVAYRVICTTQTEK